MTEEIVEIDYGMGTRTVQQLNQDLEEFLTKLKQKDPLALAEVVDAGINPEELDLNDLRTSIDIEPSGAGIDPASLAIIASIFVGRKVTLDFWTQVFLPRIKKRWGVSAVGEEKSRSKGKRKDKRGKAR